MSGESLDVPYGAILCTFTGRIQPQTALKPRGEEKKAAAGLGSLIGLPSFSSNNSQPGVPTVVEAAFFILDLHVASSPEAPAGPLRFESKTTNMRSFLGDEGSYSSDLNFVTLLRRLAPLIPSALPPSVTEVVQKGRHALHNYSTRDDFNLSSRRALSRWTSGADAPPVEPVKWEEPPVQETVQDNSGLVWSIASPAAASPAAESPAVASPAVASPAAESPAAESHTQVIETFSSPPQEPSLDESPQAAYDRFSNMEAAARAEQNRQLIVAAVAIVGAVAVLALHFL